MVYLKCFQLQVIRILVEMILIRYVVLPFLAILVCPISGNNHSFLEDLSSDSFSLGFFFLPQRIVDWLANDFKKQEGVDLLKDKQALQRLTETAEKAKMELSSLTQTSIR